MLDPKEMATALLKTHSEQTFKVQPYAGATPITEEVGYEAGKKSALIDVQNTIDAYDRIEKFINPMYFQEYLRELEHFNQVKEHIKQL